MTAAEILQHPRVAPSILAADGGAFRAQVELTLEAGAKVIHVDVMDGHFVPPITMGPIVVEGLAETVRAAGAILDVHLMVDRPERHVAAFAAAGADVISVHAEATPHVRYALDAVRDAGCLAGLAICPGTPVEAVEPALEAIDLVLCMTVNPGWGGQAFIESSVDKLDRLRRMLPREIPIEVDGGIDEDTGRRCADAGARIFVAGSSVFGRDDPAERVRTIAAAVGERS